MITLVQLFSARNFLPWPDILDLVAREGFDGVEGFGSVFTDPADFHRALEARKLSMPQAHVPLALLENDFDQAVSIARELGIKTLIAPWLPPEERPVDSSGWQALGKQLQVIDGKLRALGFGFAWHNHDFEFLTLPDGDRGMDILLRETTAMEWEADLGWIIRAGQNPLDWLKGYASRITTVHLKDIQPNADSALEDGWADLGHGITDWRPIYAVLHTLPRLTTCVAEHDNPADLHRFLLRWKKSHDQLEQH